MRDQKKCENMGYGVSSGLGLGAIVFGACIWEFAMAMERAWILILAGAWAQAEIVFV